MGPRFVGDEDDPNPRLKWTIDRVNDAPITCENLLSVPAYTRVNPER